MVEKHKTFGDMADYLDDLGRYRQTEEAITVVEDPNTIHLLQPSPVPDNNFRPWVAVLNYDHQYTQYVYGPFKSYEEAVDWSGKTKADSVSINQLRDPRAYWIS